jgi:hypothetical protein
MSSRTLSPFARLRLTAGLSACAGRTVPIAR